MAEEVVIGNVGGDGVASEVTLGRLLAAMEKMGSAKGGAAGGKEARAAAAGLADAAKSAGVVDEAFDDAGAAVKDATKKVNRFARSLSGAIGGAIGALGTSLGAFTGAILGTETSLTSFATALPFVGGLLTPLTQYLDDTVAGFQNMSATGASFGNSLEEARKGAASLGLNFNEFQDLIGNNSQQLAMLGGTVTQGAARFAAMNKNIKATGDFASLKNMGFTVMEINEGMASYIELQSRMGTLQGRSTQSLADGSAAYLEQIDRLAKVTGKTREQAEAALAAQATDAGIRGMLNALGEGTQEFKNLQLSLGLIDEVGGAAGAAMKDLIDGMPSSAETGQFIAMLGDAAPAVQDALAEIGRGADPQVLLDAMAKSGGELERFASMDAAARNQYIAVLRQTNPAMAEFLDATTTMTRMSKRDLAAASEEQDKRDKITKNLTTFEDAIRSVRQKISDAFFSSGVFENLGNTVSELAATFSDMVDNGALDEAINWFGEIIGQVSGVFGNFLGDFKEVGFVQALKNAWDALWTPDGPLMKAMDTAFEWIKTSVGPLISDAFSSMMSAVFDNLLPSWDTILIGALTGLGVILAAPFIGAAAVAVAPFVAIFAGIGAMFGWEALKDKVTDAWNGVTGIFTGIGDWWNNLSITEMIGDAWNAVTGIFTGIGDWWNNLSITEMIGDAWNAITGVFTGLGDWWSNLSITSMLSDAWTTITSFFSFEGFQIPSISGMFQGILDRVRSFFSFDFQLPSFKSFLPTWLGGEGRTLDGTSEESAPSTSTSTTPAQVSVPDTSQAIATGTALVDANSAMAQFANLPDLQRNLDAIRNGLDVTNVRSYTEAMEDLVEVLGRINEVLAEDNKGMFGSGTGVAAADALSQIGSATSGTSQGTQQLNSTMQQVLMVLSEIRDLDEDVERNTRNIIGSNLALGGVSNVSG